MLSWLRRLWQWIVYRYYMWRAGRIGKRLKKGLRFLDKVWRKHAGLD